MDVVSLIIPFTVAYATFCAQQALVSLKNIDSHDARVLVSSGLCIVPSVYLLLNLVASAGEYRSWPIEISVVAIVVASTIAHDFSSKPLNKHRFLINSLVLVVISSQRVHSPLFTAASLCAQTTALLGPTVFLADHQVIKQWIRSIQCSLLFVYIAHGAWRGNDDLRLYVVAAALPFLFTPDRDPDGLWGDCCVLNQSFQAEAHITTTMMNETVPITAIPAVVDSGAPIATELTSPCER